MPIHGVGWFSRRVPDPLPTIAFYEQGVGLHKLRARERSGMFWAGETQTFWVNPGGSTPVEYTDRAQADVVPVFRVRGGLDNVKARLEACGARFINDRQLTEGRIAYFLDPSGNVTGIQERVPTSSRPEDQEADRKWAAGETTVPGIPPMPNDIQHLAWVILPSPEVEPDMAFYRDVLGLAPAGSRGIMLALGEGTLLEFIPAQDWQRPAIPADRSQVNNAMILRVTDLDAIADRVRAAGCAFVNEPFDGSGRLAYFLDPTGRLVGLQERKPESERPEDIEARRRRGEA